MGMAEDPPSPVAMTMGMIMSVASMLSNGAQHFCRKPHIVQNFATMPPQSHSSSKQKAAHPEASQALYLAVAAWESFGRRLQRPGNRTQGQNVRDQVGEGVEGIGKERLGVEEVTPHRFPECHEAIDVEPNAGDANTSVLLVRRRQIRVVMCVIVAMTTVMAVLRVRRHDGFQ